MNLLVTGGAGFIGSHFVLRHVEQYPEDWITVLDKLTYAADKSFLDPIEKKIHFEQGDIADAALVNRLVQKHKVECIVNFAAETHVDRSIDNEEPFLHTNIIGTQRLIEVCKEHPQLKLFHISTDEVHGDIGDRDPPRSVSDPLYPSSPYAASKAAAELLVLAAMRTYGIHAAISRCTNNYGPHQAQEKFIPTVIRHALNDESIPLYGDGKNKRDWLCVTDHCDALEVILHTDAAFWDPDAPAVHSNQPRCADHIYQIGADDERENIEVARMILEIVQKPSSLISFVADRPGHDWRYALDSSVVRKLGWNPKVPFEDGLRMTVEWYKSRLSAS